MKEIPNTELLCSIHHDFELRASMKIFNVSKKAKEREIFSTEEISGCKTIPIYTTSDKKLLKLWSKINEFEKT